MMPVRIKQYPQERCGLCMHDFSLWPRVWHAMSGPRTYRGALLIEMIEVCEACARQEAACDDARSNGRPFTALAIERCICGRSVPLSLSACVTCHREARLLEAEHARIRLNARLIQQLKQEVRHAA